MNKTRLTLFAISTILCGCGVESHQVMQDAEAIYWHEGNRYSAAIRDGDSISIVPLPSRSGSAWTVKIFTDADDSQWYQCAWDYSNMNGTKEGAWCDIHIRSIGDLNTGSWDHGKFGTGKTTRID